MKLAELHENFELQYNLFKNVREAINATSYWSVGNVVDFTETAFTHHVENLQYREHWGNAPVSIPVGRGNLTWLDLYRLADQAIVQSGDEHHIYIEAFDLNGNDLILITGS